MNMMNDKTTYHLVYMAKRVLEDTDTTEYFMNM